MTLEEFSNEFDTLLNSYSAKNDFGKTSVLLELDEYEKSVFLTKAQEDIVLSYYKGSGVTGESFEDTEEVRRYLSTLLKTTELTPTQDSNLGVSSKSFFFSLPKDLMFIVYESVEFNDNNMTCTNTNPVLVMPTTTDEVNRILSNPFRKPSRNRVLRLDVSDNLIELISEYNISKYFLRYLSAPSPIILIDLPEELSINGISEKTECALEDIMHRAILDRAVKLAIASKSITK